MLEEILESYNKYQGAYRRQTQNIHLPGLWGILWSVDRRKSIHSASPAYEKFPPADTPKSSNFEISSWSTGHLIYMQFGATVHRMVDGVALGFTGT